MTPEPFGVIVLAAGSASRFGSPKQVALYRNRPLLDWAVDHALDSGAQQVVVVINPRITLQLVCRGVQVVVNKSPEAGLGSSLALGIQVIRREIDRCVIALGDQPNISAGHLKELAAAISEHKTLAGSLYGEDEVGVPAAFHRVHFDQLSALVGDRGAKGLLKKFQNQCAYVRLSPEAQLDIDVPADLERR